MDGKLKIEDDLLDFEDDEAVVEQIAVKKEGNLIQATIDHRSSFRDLLLRPELLRVVNDFGFEHPSPIQEECISHAVLGIDILCQAKSGMGKTAVFVLSTLQQLDTTNSQVSVLVLCLTRELAFQISQEYVRFSRYMAEVKVGVFIGGLDITRDERALELNPPHIVVGTPGRIKALVCSKKLDLANVKHFIIDECDKVLESLVVRADVQQIFRQSAFQKQVIMFSATLNEETRSVCTKFMKDPVQVYADGAQLTLHGLQQHYVNMRDDQKTAMLTRLLDVLEFNQVVIFVATIDRCKELAQVLADLRYTAIAIHSVMSQEDRLTRYRRFKDFRERILVATDIFGRGIDVAKVNIVFNYDMPRDADSYLHRVGRTGRFATKGMAITFVSSSDDAGVLNDVQQRFQVAITELPEQIDASNYIARR